MQQKIKKPTTDRVYDILLEKGPKTISEISFLFRRRSARGKDAIYRTVLSALKELHNQKRVIATNVPRENKTYWNAL